MIGKKVLHCVAAIVAVLSLTPAQAEDWKLVGAFGWTGLGKVYQLEEGHAYWVGEFTGTFFNDKGEGSPLHQAGLKCPGFQDLDFNSKKGRAEGYCTANDTAGDQAYLVWKCAGEPGGLCKGSFDYTGGTGKYKGISGSNTFTGFTLSWKDGTATGFATWNR